MTNSFSLNRPENPTIDGTGETTFGPTTFCMWKTKNGPTSILTIYNPSGNTLNVVISNAPPTIVTTKAKPLNGPFEIPPNSPTTNVQAIGNFMGVQVTIVNTTNASISAECHVFAVSN